jgi:hypothetical protein
MAQVPQSMTVITDMLMGTDFLQPITDAAYQTCQQRALPMTAGSRLRVNRVVLTLGSPIPVYPYQPTSTHPSGWSVRLYVLSTK